MKLREIYKKFSNVIISSGLIIVLIILAASMWYLYYFYPSSLIGPKQPIPFSHRLHVTDKQIDCRYCHSYVDKSKYAGLPPVETCMHCHKYIITNLPQIVTLRNHYAENRPIAWVRINRVPDHVYFNHSRHIKSKLECVHCHGEVEKMDRIFEKNKFQMGFCLGCHKVKNAPIDCWTCHR